MYISSTFIFYLSSILSIILCISISKAGSLVRHLIFEMNVKFYNVLQSQDNKPWMGGAPQIERLWKSSTQVIHESYRYSNHEELK